MKKFLGLALAGALSVAALPAVAADYPLKAPPPPIWTWTGFYIGVQAGATWSHTRWTNAAGVTSADFQGDGGIFGGTVGWNWQGPGSPWVAGIEGDWSWTGNKATTAPAACPICIQKINWLATVRGRLGHANGPLLFYVTGGVAFARFSPTIPGVAGFVDYNDTGWTAGAGLEGALGGGWSLKAEYLYVDFAQSPVFFAPTAIVANYNHIHVLRAGINYKFGSW